MFLFNTVDNPESHWTSPTNAPLEDEHIHIPIHCLVKVIISGLISVPRLREGMLMRYDEFATATVVVVVVVVAVVVAVAVAVAFAAAAAAAVVVAAAG